MSLEWTVEEFLETELGQAAAILEGRMDMALGEQFESGDVSQRLDLLFEGLCDMAEVEYYCARVSQIYGEDVLKGATPLHSALQGAISQALCLGILKERMSHG